MSTLAEYIQVAMECGALKKHIANREAAAIDARPLEPFGSIDGVPVLVRPTRDPERLNRARKTGSAAYRATLVQLGMFPTADGRMRIYPPPRDTSDAGIASWHRAVAEAERGR